jgi:hypothetical protein
MSSSPFGGGFFYTPFTKLISISSGSINTGVNNLYGLWQAMLTGYGAFVPFHTRWMQLNVIGNLGGAASFDIQIGRGAPGAEVNILDSAAGVGQGFLHGHTDGTSLSPTGWNYSFPVDIPPAVPVSVRFRCLDSVNVESVNVLLNAWG